MSVASSVAAEPVPRRGSASTPSRRGVATATASRAASSRLRAIFLVVWIVYPTIYTIVRSFFGRDGVQDFVWFDNYKSLFTIDVLAHGDQEQRDLGGGRARRS